MTLRNEIAGLNTGYVLELYDRYRQDPSSVDESARHFFANWSPPTDSATSTAASAPDIAKIVGAVNYAQSIRAFGHLAAQLDPLGSTPPGDPSLDLAAHGISEDDLRALPASLIGGPLVNTAQNALEATEALRRVYSATTGYDFDHIRLPEEREWLRIAAECGEFAFPPDGRALLEQPNRSRGLRTFHSPHFPRQTPLLD